MIDVSEVSVSVAGAALLRRTDLAVDRGEAVAVRGPNGSGKTTLLRVIAGEITPSGGTVRVAGEAVDDRSSVFRRRVAGSLGLPPFARSLTLREHLTLIATTWGADATAAEAAADEVGDELGLSRLADRFPHELSSGQRQLAGLATVLVRPFDIVLLDEPEQRLDSDHVSAVIGAFARRRDAGATVVVATHSDRIAAELTDRTVLLAAA
ncbi:ABC transporter ATP-binding protein [Microbacterium sp. CFH 90308]|uniref:ABC transporter ATP-binding protein n=1 Tax=Microbacterium salsuginis TaxID=2722803 RepID=A0ABX1KIW3_9MICO|nr:ATP-binding cassette domain-containing protein [Microbacterium sp. CFH 90308]NLP86130.1 ABC transporter ATP-binding protein [Microbacterium sp. CFH 90308]